jgi:serine/threonine protein kinase
MEFEAGTELGGYRLVDRIGAGGMGEVWKAEDIRLGRTVAIKILPLSLESDPVAKARLEREARTAAKLYHPNVATIHALDEAHGRSYVVMEFVPGEPLSHLMQRGPIGEAEVCRIGKHVADALAEAHAHGIVHRDIKPDNIILSGDRVKVLDFGIAKQVGPVAFDADRPPTLTQAGMILGTVQYMSPEQALGRQLDHRSDLFSLGVVLYQMLSGELPFEGETITEMLTRIVRDEPVDIAKRIPSITPALAAVIRRCLQKKPEDRFDSAEDVAVELSAVFLRASTAVTTSPNFVRTEKLPSLTAPTVVRETPRRGGSRLLWITIAIFLLAATAAVFFVMRRSIPAQSVATTSTPSTSIDVTASAPSETGTIVETASSTATSTIVEAPAAVTTAATAPTSAPVVAASSTQPPATETIAAAPPVATTSNPPAPLLSRAAFDRGMTLFFEQRWNQARAAFTAALVGDPADSKAKLRLAEINLIHGNRSEAQQLYGQLDSTRLDAREQSLAAIGAAVAAGDREKGEQLASEFMARYPDDRELALMKQVALGELKPKDQRRIGQRPVRPGRRRF